MKKKTKKIVIIIVSVILAVALIAMGIAFLVKYIKNNVGDTAIKFESQTALAGDTVKVPITISKNHGLFAGQIKIAYNPNTLSFVSCANGDVFDECEANANAGVLPILVTQSFLENTKLTGTVATVNFEIKEGAEKGVSDLIFDDTTDFCDKDSEFIDVKSENGKITVK